MLKIGLISLLFGLLFVLSGCIECSIRGLPSREAMLQPADAAGVSITLAKNRKHRVADLGYDLSLEIDPYAPTFKGTCEISFALRALGLDDLLVDFGGKSVDGLWVNERRVEPSQIANHIVIPKRRLSEGPNKIRIDFTSGIGAAGEGLIKVDEDGRDAYLYTLNVPADAHLVFPCFDQPDLKAKFKLHVKLPAVPTYETPWSVITNTPMKRILTPGDNGPHDEYWFEETKPLSTYVFAFAIGPFYSTSRRIDGREIVFHGRKSQEELIKKHADEVIRLHAESLKFLENWFGVPYPFKQFEFVCVPDFPFGGMEHAGCIFYGEDPVLFRGVVTKLREARRADLIAHETAHMWFGDLVTMPWFDDVWLKEGYATFMAHKTLENIIPDTDHDAAFFLRLYPSALETDITEGSTPMRQPLLNMADAKSNYGPIIYRKGPAVMRALEYMIGEEAFRKGSNLFLKRHAFDCGSWTDLRHALEDAWGQGRDSLKSFGEAWIEEAGVPSVLAIPEDDQLTIAQFGERDGCDSGVVEKESSSILSFRGEEGEPIESYRGWPLSLEFGYILADGKVRTGRSSFKYQSSTVQIPGLKESDFAFANFNNRAYAQFNLDSGSLKYSLKNFRSFNSLLLRSMLWEAIWIEVREGGLHPEDYVEFAMANVWQERDQRLIALVSSRLETVLTKYLEGRAQRELCLQFESELISQIEGNTYDAGTRLLLLRRLIGSGRSQKAKGLLAGIADGSYTAFGLPVSKRDRWNAVTRLMLLGDKRADSLLDLMVSIEDEDEAKRRVFMVECARGDIKSKRELYFRFFDDKDLPERWVQDGAAIFFSSEQAELTDEFLADALDRCEWIKKNRKIFFLAAWLDACVKSRLEQDSVDLVEAYLSRDWLPKDIASKVKVPLYHLKRTVAVRD